VEVKTAVLFDAVQNMLKTEGHRDEVALRRVLSEIDEVCNGSSTEEAWIPLCTFYGSLLARATNAF
jgi:hypothetical protein